MYNVKTLLISSTHNEILNLMHKKNFTPTTIKGRVILIILVAITAFYLGKPVFQITSTSIQNSVVTSETGQLTPTTNISDTSNWKTYTDDKYGLSLKHPQDWQLKSIYITKDDVNNKSNEELKKYPRRIELRKTFANQDFSGITIDFEGMGSCINPRMKASQTEINGIKVESNFFINNINHEVYCFNNFDLKNFPKLMIGVSYPKKDQEAVDKIISTFKFTN
jgi:hypothetical protein